MKITKFLDLLLFLNSPYSNLKIMMMMVTIVMMILMTTVDCEARGQTVYTWRSPGALFPQYMSPSPALRLQADCSGEK